MDINEVLQVARMTELSWFFQWGFLLLLQSTIVCIELDAQHVVDGANRLLVPAGETGLNQLNAWIHGFSLLWLYWAVEQS